MITSTSRSDRFDWLEDPPDFPYYSGDPVNLSGWQWLFLMFMVVLGFTALVLPFPFAKGTVGQFLPAALFLAIPLAGLAIVTPEHWTAIFRKVGLRDVLLMVGFWLLNVVLSLLVGFVVFKLNGATPNPIISNVAQMTGSNRVLLFARVLPQLLGEEVLTMLPFLAILHALHTRLGLSRKSSVGLAWFASAVMFAAAHLPTYGWDFVQCFTVIGTARLALTLPFIKTKNIWVSMGAHVLTDWAYLGFSLAAAR